MDVLLLTDVDGWAWDLKAKKLKKYLPYNINIIKQNNFSKKIINDYNSIHSFGWMISSENSKISTAISSHNWRMAFLNDAKNNIPKFNGLSCVSRELYDIAKFEKLNKNIFLCSNGVDEQLFVPNKKIINKNKFTIGWISQKTNGNLNKRPCDMKGYQHILLPLIDRLKEYKDIEFLIHTNNSSNAIDHSMMPSIYNNMDLYICTSLFEGTPNGVFEAASSGLPVISTSVGCVPELIRNGHNGILLNNYKNNIDVINTINSFVSNILFLKENREFCKIMGYNNRLEIEKKWTWKERSKQWIPLLENGRIK